MIKKYTSQNITWIDVEEPSQREVKSLMEEYKIHPLVAEELLTPTFKPLVDLRENCIYLILHFPTFRRPQKEGENPDGEIDFIIGKNFLITTHYDAIDPLRQSSKMFEVETILRNEKEEWKHAGYLFYHIVQRLYDALADELDYMEDLQEEMEKSIFGGNEKQMVEEISRANHNLLDFKQATVHHKEILDSLEIAGKKFFGEDFAYHLTDINNKYRKISYIIEKNMENLKELRETNDSLLTTKQNEIMKIFTILAFVTFPLSLVASIFGMNATHIPIIGVKGDFWYIMSGMLFTTGLMFWYFKYKKWF